MQTPKSFSIIDFEKVTSIVKKEASLIHHNLTPGWEDSLSQLFDVSGLNKIGSLKDMKIFCKTLKKAKLQEENKDYLEDISLLVFNVRKSIFLSIDEKNFKKVEFERMLLVDFLKSLPENKIQDFSINMFRIAVPKLSCLRLKWDIKSYEALESFLGDDSYLLKKINFLSEGAQKLTPDKIKQKLLTALNTLKKGESFSPTWIHASCSDTTWRYFKTHNFFKNPDLFKEFLGTDVLLRNPFKVIKKEQTPERMVQEIKKILNYYFKKGETFSPSQIQKLDPNIAQYFIKRKLFLCEDRLTSFLNSIDPSILERNPYLIINKRQTQERMIPELKTLLMKNLNKGDFFSPGDLYNMDSNIYSYFNLNNIFTSEENVKTFFDNIDPSILERNPFKFKNKEQSDARMINDLKIILTDTLDKSETFSPTDIRIWDANIYGYFNKINVFESEDALKNFLNPIDSSILQRNPFKRIGEFVTPESLKLRLKIVSEKTHFISPSSISSFDNYALVYLYKHYRHEGKIDWIRILLELFPEDSWKRFTYRRSYFFSSKGQSENFTTTNTPSILDALNNGSGIYDKSTLNPEELLIEKQAQINKQKDEALHQERSSELHHHISCLSEPEQELILKFYDEEDDVDMKVLEPIILKLKNLVRKNS